MSVHREGKGWRVKWEQGGRQRSKTFARKDDADTYDREIKRAKQLGPYLMRELTRSAETLDDFIRGPWQLHASTLAPKTKAKYRWVLNNHMGDLRDEPLVTLDVARLSAHQAWLLKEGVPANTVREILRTIGAILAIAVDHGRLPANPMRSLRRVPADRTAAIAPFTPNELEAMIADATGRDLAVLALGGHLGLRPIEIRSCPWARWDGDQFTIEAIDTKPSAQPRTIAVPKATQKILREWRLQSGGRGEDPIIGPMNARNMNARNQWLRRISKRDDVTLYTLRHTHASMLHYAGHTVPEAAERMGHTTTVHWNHYARVINGMRGKRYADLDALIDAARKPQPSVTFRTPSVDSAKP